MRTIIGYVVFIILQIIFIPFAIIGAIVVGYKQIFISKKLGVSSTAIEIINGRWAMDRFGLRKDEATVSLFKALPNASSFGLWLALFPLYVLKLISGKNLIYPVTREPGKEGLADLVPSRTIYFDTILKRSLAKSEQFVVMGAGLDTRCYGELVSEKHKLFELDQKPTQELKKDALNKAKIDTSNVRFVQVDFTKEKWYQKLTEAGFEENKVTTFLWEGVTLYLSEQDVRNTLRDIKQHVAKGSVLVVDFYADKFVKGELFPGMKSSLKALKITDEELGFGLPFNKTDNSSIASLLEGENLKLGEVYFMGHDTKKGTWMAVAEVLV